MHSTLGGLSLNLGVLTGFYSLAEKMFGDLIRVGKNNGKSFKTKKWYIQYRQ